MEHKDEFENLANLARITAQNTRTRVTLILRKLDEQYPGETRLPGAAKELLNEAYWFCKLAAEASKSVGNPYARDLFPAESYTQLTWVDVDEMADRLEEFADKHHYGITTHKSIQANPATR